MANSLKQCGMRVITVANRKGGVGKTSSVIQIASGLARRGERVLVIDGDPQGNLTLFFGDREKKDISAMLASMASGERIKIDEYLCKSVRRHLDIIPAKNRNLRLEMRDTAIANAYEPFLNLMSTMKERYDWVIIDSSPANSPLERLLIRASDAVIIPLEFQLFSVSGLESILEEVDYCAEEAKRDIKVHSLIFTKAENRLNRVNAYRQVFSSFHIPIFEICKSEYVTRSIEKSRTIWECGPASYAARDYARIIEKGFLETT